MAEPVRLDPFQRIVNVGWANDVDLFAVVQFSEQDGAAGPNPIFAAYYIGFTLSAGGPNVVCDNADQIPGFGGYATTWVRQGQPTPSNRLTVETITATELERYHAIALTGYQFQGISESQLVDPGNQAVFLNLRSIAKENPGLVNSPLQISMSFDRGGSPFNAGSWVARIDVYRFGEGDASIGFAKEEILSGLNGGGAALRFPGNERLDFGQMTKLTGASSPRFFQLSTNVNLKTGHLSAF